MSARRAASVVLASVVLLSTAGCSFFAPQTTLKPYDASDGINVSVGNVLVRNALLLSNDGTNASLLVSLYNQSDNGVSVKFQYEGTDDTGAATKINTNVFVNPGSVKSLGGDGEKQFLLNGIDTKPGELFPVFVQYGQTTGKELLLPVLDGTLEQYKDLLPTAVATPAS